MNASLRFKYTEATLGQRRRRACVCVDRSPRLEVFAVDPRGLLSAAAAPMRTIAQHLRCERPNLDANKCKQGGRRHGCGSIAAP